MSHPQLKLDLLEQQKNELNNKNNTLEKDKEQAKKLSVLSIILSLCFLTVIALQVGLGMFNNVAGTLSLIAPNTPLKILTLSFLVAAFDSIAIQINFEIKRQQYITAEQISQVEHKIAIQTEQVHKLKKKMQPNQEIKPNPKQPTIEELLQTKQELLENEPNQPAKQNILTMNK